MSEKETPLMRQYNGIKDRYPDSVLFFRLGDFFETFGDDAHITAKVCGITLTKRNNGAAGDMPLAGFPHHQLDVYLPKLVKAGYRVAVCDQLEDPKLARGIVRRDVTEVVTPGVAMYDKILDSRRNNFVASIAYNSNDQLAGIAYCDISTGEFFAGEIAKSSIRETIEAIAPAEIIISKSYRKEVDEILYGMQNKPSITRLEEWIFEHSFANELLIKQFESRNLKGFGIEHLAKAQEAAGAIVHYISETQKGALPQITGVKQINNNEYMQLDYATRRNLEITYTFDGSSEGALISVLDKTLTGMGARLLKKWITMPLLNPEKISNRLDSVEYFFNNNDLLQSLRTRLKEIGDIERMITRIAAGRGSSRDIAALSQSLAVLPEIKDALIGTANNSLKILSDKINILESLVHLIGSALVDEPSVQFGSGNMFRQGFNEELDTYVTAKTSGKQWISDYQEHEREKSGINSLKVSYNNVFGYYIEITNAHKSKVPENYQRKQTLTNAERYTTAELKDIESKILSAEEKINSLEQNLLIELRQRTAEFTVEIQINSLIVATVDCLLCFALISKEYKYIRPIIDDSDVIEIRNGRHPVVERILPQGTAFTPNSTTLDATDQQIHIITGPNMAGKSCYLRQVALMVLLGQIGCFVPAEYCRFGLVDRIFTRLGAQDSLQTGESTFLVEMQEAANILNNAGKRSLILLDEVGRGTATFDGISIAWALTEYIHDTIGAKTLFATHYHELNELEERFERIKNYRVEVVETGNTVVFTHKVTQGGSDHSFGIHVAQMAGMPYFVTERASEIMASFEGTDQKAKPDVGKVKTRKKSPPDQDQLSIFEIRDDALREKIAKINIDNITPLQAFQVLAELAKEARN